MSSPGARGSGETRSECSLGGGRVALRGVRPRSLVPGALRSPRLLFPRHFSREPVFLIWPEGKLSPQGVVGRPSHPVSVAELHWRLLVSAAHLSEPGGLCRVSPSVRGPAPGLCVQGPPGPAARTWPTLALPGRAVAGEGRRIPGKVPAAVPSAQLSVRQSSTELGGLRGPPGTQGR